MKKILFLLLLSGFFTVISCKKNDDTKPFVCGDDITDIDGNVYHTVSIGSQCWMKENLKTSKYNNGTLIPTDLNDAAWEATTSGAFSVYDNNIANINTYGKLYNWYAVSTGKLAPAGWHVPDSTECRTLSDFLGDAGAGNKMKSISPLWDTWTGITNTNNSGFSGLPAGWRNNTGGYSYITKLGLYWTTSAFNPLASVYFYLDYSRPDFYKSNLQKQMGFSVRCIKD